MVSLQSFLIVLAFAEQRKSAGKNFILVAEEPELHLHPSLHKRLANRIRAVSTQSITTTHSPVVASAYKPTESIFLRNSKGELTAQKMRSDSVRAIQSNAIRKLYVQKREAFYEALLGPGIVIPEGEFDYTWLRLFQQLAECSEEASGAVFDVSPLSIVPTQDSITQTYEEVTRLRPDAVPMVDGDDSGAAHLEGLSKLPKPPESVVRLGAGAAIECLAAWILEPGLPSPGSTLQKLLPDPSKRNLAALQGVLREGTNKKSRQLHEALAFEAGDTAQCRIRAAEFLNDLAAVMTGGAPRNPKWQKQTHTSGIQVWVAAHIQRE